MASTEVQRECEQWIIENWLPDHCGKEFAKKRLRMQGQGVCEFNAVSGDGKIVANISTATAHTYQGSVASGKLSKLRADCLLLHLVEAERKLLVLTEPCMCKLANKEQEEGRLPFDIRIYHAELPENLKVKLTSARKVASEEVRKKD